MTGKDRLDKVDRSLLNSLQRDNRIPLDRLARKLRIPKSTIHYRIRRLEKAGIIKGYGARLDAAQLGHDYLGIVAVRVTSGPQGAERIGKRLAEVNGAWAVYYVLGDIDFIVVIRAHDRDDYMRKLNEIFNVGDIERTTTHIVARVFKDPILDPTVPI